MTEPDVGAIRITRVLDAISPSSGRVVAWLILPMVLSLV